MLSYITHSKIDKIKWDLCVDKDPEAQVFFYSWFLDAVCDNWDGIVSGDYEAVFPLPYKKKLSFYYIVQPYFTRTLDICTPDKTLKNMNRFISIIPKKFRLQEFCVLPLQWPDPIFAESNKKTYQSVLLNQPYEILKKAFSTNTLQNLKKAEKNKLQLYFDTDTKTVADNFKKIKGNDLVKFGDKEFKTLKKVMDTCLKQQHGYTRAVKTADGEIVASAFFMYAHNRIIYLKGSTSEKGKKTGAMHFLMAKLIEEFSAQNVIFDFGGSSVPSLARFFKGFGATDQYYYSIRKNNLPLAIRWLK